MLEALRIRDLGVIDDVEIEFGPGLSVVTGETGAGKTMVVTSLQLLFGGRGDASRVRTGAEQASVEGRLTVVGCPPAIVAAEEAGATIEDGELLLRRTVSAGGRSRAHVGGAGAPVAVLAAIGDDVFTMHGQADQMRLSHPAEQRRALDRYAGLDLTGYRAAYSAWLDAQARLTERIADAATLQREADRLEFGLAEIDSAAPVQGEDVELSALTTRLAAADDLRGAARMAHDALLGDADDPASDAANVQNLLGRAAHELDGASGSDAALGDLARRVGELTALVAEVGADLGAYSDAIDSDPGRLAAAQERRAALAALVRRYGSSPERTPDLAGVLAWADAARTRLSELDTSQEAIDGLTDRRDRARAAAATAAAALRRSRRSAAKKLAAAVTAELGGLAMAGADLQIAVANRPALPGAPALVIGRDDEPSAVGPDGGDEVEFLLRTRPDSPAIAVQKGASGGELSRVMLALEVVLAGTDPVPVIVFDEVDAGVGGRAAIEVGRRLSRLAARHQVIVVTHLAQVAAFADHHLVVSTGADSSVSRSGVSVVAGEERLRELARMLGGRDTETARQHAAELLRDAAQEKAAGPRTERLLSIPGWAAMMRG